MKQYMNPKGKGFWANFWGDKVKTKIKRVFKKSARQAGKNEANKPNDDLF
jgi:hypothetical protein